MYTQLSFGDAMTLQQSLKHANDMHSEILESTVVHPLEKV